MTEIEAFLEQLEAAHDVAHHYTCFMCEEMEGSKPVIIGVEHEDGLRAIVVVACVSCLKELPDASKKTTQILEI